jgi:hypothetical protein
MDVPVGMLAFQLMLVQLALAPAAGFASLTEEMYVAAPT